MPLATMKNVAQYAGVSTATVSRALTHPEKVSSLTRKKVEEAVLHTGYTLVNSKNPLKVSKSRTILVIMPNISLPSFSDIIQGIKTKAAELGYWLLFVDYERQQKPFNQLITSLMLNQCDGLILFDTKILNNQKKDLPHHPLPAMVVATQCPRQFGLPMVYIDNLAAAFRAVSYLCELGHHRVATICAPQEMTVSQYLKQGYIQALQRKGIALEKRYFTYGNLTYSSGMDCFNTLMLLPQPPSAIFCHSDIMAIGALAQAKKLNIKIPQQLSLMGCDAIIESEYSDPPLTTISQQGYQIGQETVALLVKMLQGKTSNSNNQSFLLESEIIVRGTTAPPAK